MTTLAAEQFNAAMLAMVGRLSDFVSPPSTLAVLQASERAVGLGNLRGNEERAALAVLGVRGGRVEGRVRFDLVADTPAEAAAAALDLQAELRGARVDPLRPWMRDFLVLEPAGGEAPAHLGAVDAWRQSLEYRVLYEYRYEDPEEAAALLVRIPVAVRGEHHEDALVTRDLVRWDAEGAPPLRLFGPRTLGELSLLLHPGAALPPGSVTLLRTHEGAVGPPVAHPDLAAFAAAAVAGTPAGRHGRVALPGLAELRDAFVPAGGAVTLVLLDGSNGSFQPRTLDDLRGARLEGPGDRFELAYASPAGFPAGAEAVVYLRAGRGHSA